MKKFIHPVVVPPTRMDETQLVEDYYSAYGKVGARTEIPVVLCVGNQARVEDGATVLSTSLKLSSN